MATGATIQDFNAGDCGNSGPPGSSDCTPVACDVKVFDVIASLYVNCFQYTYDQIFNGDPEGKGAFSDSVTGVCLTDSKDLETFVSDICYIYRLERKFTREGLYIYRNVGLDEPSTVVAVIPSAELATDGTGQASVAIKTQYDSGTDSVTQVAFNFLDADNEFKINQLTAKRPEAKQTDTIKQISLPFIMHVSQAEELVNRLLADSRLNLIKHTFRLPPKYAWIGKGDVIELDHGTFKDVVRITDTDFNADQTQSCTAMTCSTASSPIRTEVHPQTNKTIGGGGVGSTAMLFDIPALNPYDIPSNNSTFELYAGVYPEDKGSWKGGYFAMSIAGDAYQTFFNMAGLPARGEVMIQWRAANALTNKKWVTDKDTLQLTAGTNSWNANFNTDKATIDANAMRNLAAYGSPGRWEIIQFEKIENGVMSGIVRGLRGTEGECGKHQPGDFVVLVAPWAAFFSLPRSDLGKSVKYKGVSSDQYFKNAFEWNDGPLKGNSRRAFAPAHFKATRDTDGNLTFSWLRRDKAALPWEGWKTEDVINTEGGMSFSVDICRPNTGSLLRTIVVQDTNVVYSSAQQSDDQAGGLSAFMLKISQIGDIGPGFVGTEIVDV